MTPMLLRRWPTPLLLLRRCCRHRRCYPWCYRAAGRLLRCYRHHRCCRRPLPYRSFARQRHHLSHRRFAVDVTDAAAPLDAPPPYCSVGIVAIRRRRRSPPATAVPRRSRKAGQHLYCCSAVAVDISGATHGATSPLAGRLLRCYRHHRCCQRPLPYRSFAQRPMLPRRWPPHLQTVSLLSCCCLLTPSPAVPRRSRKSAPLVRLVY